MIPLRRAVALILVVGIVGTIAVALRAQTAGSAVTVTPLFLQSQTAYYVSCELQAARELVVRAPMNGYVREVSVTLGDVVQAQRPLIQLDRELPQIGVDRATAELQAATAELQGLKQVSTAPAAAIAKVEAAVSVAEANKKEADYWLRQTTLASPFSGQIVEIPAERGQYVTAGQALIRISDYSNVVVWMPVDSKEAKIGQKVNLSVESESYSGSMKAVLPLISAHRPLAQLRGRLATAVIEVQNSQQKLRPAQGVACPLVPNGPLATMANRNIHKGVVQVLRGDVVRQVTVVQHVAVNADYTTVSGEFYQGDRLITSSSRTLRDGTKVEPDQVQVAP